MTGHDADVKVLRINPALTRHREEMETYSSSLLGNIFVIMVKSKHLTKYVIYEISQN